MPGCYKTLQSDKAHCVQSASSKCKQEKSTNIKHQARRLKTREIHCVNAGV